MEIKNFFVFFHSFKIGKLPVFIIEQDEFVMKGTCPLCSVLIHFLKTHLKKKLQIKKYEIKVISYEAKILAKIAISFVNDVLNVNSF